MQPTDFLLDGSRLLFLAPPRFRIAYGYVCSFHVQADDDAWTVTAHGPVSLQNRALPGAGRAAGIVEGGEPVAVEPNEPLALDVQLLVGHRLERYATSA
ncbi:hypothetical protein [Actinomycetospora cinnamomea]|uniref:hypothetical protein n=1 Tax=Actinomycetospora cinnamomea TaxID=663609 RepID=UPI0010579D6D|nr:hypothetical protein [Actinomycetospora cinnamomea]